MYKLIRPRSPAKLCASPRHILVEPAHRPPPPPQAASLTLESTTPLNCAISYTERPDGFADACSQQAPNLLARQNLNLRPDRNQGSWRSPEHLLSPRHRKIDQARSRRGDAGTIRYSCSQPLQNTASRAQIRFVSPSSGEAPESRTR